MREQTPGMLNRGLFKIIAETEIAEHLKKGVMARGVADIVQIVMLAAGAHATLACHRTRSGRLLHSQKIILKRHHARIGEQQCAVAGRHQRGARPSAVIMRLKIGLEFAADVCGFHGAVYFRGFATAFAGFTYLS